MTEIFSKEDLSVTLKQKKKNKIILGVVSAVFSLILLFLIILYLFQPYKSPNLLTIRIIAIALSCLFAFFFCLFYTLCIKRLTEYEKLLRGVFTGVATMSVASFDSFSEEKNVKNGLDFKVMYFSEYNEKEKKFYKRKVLLDDNKEFPDFKNGQIIKFYTRSYVLCRYEVLDGNTENAQ